MRPTAQTPRMDPMRVRRLNIRNFRGVGSGQVDFTGHSLLVGGNNIGKSTICEALDLVLGPERLYRRPIIDEHDFHESRYLDDLGEPIDIVIKALLVELPLEAQRRFFRHLRRWDDAEQCFVDKLAPETLKRTDAEGTSWTLPVVFFGRYDREEDDFVGNTFFDHPIPATDESETKIGNGRTYFGREQKRLCGFIFLRALRTGTRALSLQRGSLLDTILRLGDSNLTEMWENTLKQLRDLKPAIGEIGKLKEMREQIHQRLARFVNLSSSEDTTFFASDLTRNHLREVVRLFLAAHPAPHRLPFQKLGSGTINLLVFALLTFIADLRGSASVIFAMEEPETALPPHTQRRIVRHVLGKMGQVIATSHSPYVIELFKPTEIVVLDRSADGVISSRSIPLVDGKTKRYEREKRQMAEAILSRAVLVVEGATEAVLFPAAAEVLEADSTDYEHFDLAGVTVFDAGGDTNVASYGPFFAEMGKPVFAFYDKQSSQPTPEIAAQMDRYDIKIESPTKGIEELLTSTIPVAVLRGFLTEVQKRQDYPANLRDVKPGNDEAQVRELAKKVLVARKGSIHSYAAILVTECKAKDLPDPIREILTEIHSHLGKQVVDGE